MLPAVCPLPPSLPHDLCLQGEDQTKRLQRVVECCVCLSPRLDVITKFLWLGRRGGECGGRGSELRDCAQPHPTHTLHTHAHRARNTVVSCWSLCSNPRPHPMCAHRLLKRSCSGYLFSSIRAIRRPNNFHKLKRHLFYFFKIFIGV